MKAMKCKLRITLILIFRILRIACKSFVEANSFFYKVLLNSYLSSMQLYYRIYGDVLYPYDCARI